MLSETNLYPAHNCVLYKSKSIVRELKPLFSKNGLDYDLMERNEKVALFATYSVGKLCGFEVVRIYKSSKGMESITSNRKFGFDGSKCFFPGEPNRARRYYQYLSAKLSAFQGTKDQGQLSTIKVSA